MTVDDMQQYYRARAPEYEQIYYREIPDRRREIDEEIDRLKGLVTGRRVLELACGTGYWTQVMSRTAAEISAMDISDEMFKEAKKKSYPCPVKFTQADLYETKFAPEGYDIVALGFWISHHPRQEMSRLFDILASGVRKDGLIWTIDNNPPAEGSRLESMRVDEHGNNFKKRQLDNGREYVIMKNYFEKEELQAILEDHFNLVRLDYGKYYWSAVLSSRG